MIGISCFASHLDNDPMPCRFTWPDLVDLLREPRRCPCKVADCVGAECRHKRGDAWSPATFVNGGKRRKADVAEVSALVVDIDHVDTATLVATHGKLRRRQHVLCASHSDRTTDRCARAVLALSRPVRGDEWPRFWPAAIAELDMPADPACSDASRLYFAPSRPADADYFFVVVSDGEPVDVDAILAKAPREAPTVAQQLTLGDGGMVAPGERHAMLKSLAGRMRSVGAGESEIYEALERANRLRCVPPKPDAELRDLAAWAAAQSVSTRISTNGHRVSSRTDEPPPDEDVPHAADSEDEDSIGKSETDARVSDLPTDPWKADLDKALADVKARLGREPSKRGPMFVDATQLLARAFAALVWLVSGLITRGGVAIIGAEPKATKTWLGTEIAVAIATGTKVCGEFFAACGTVAYFFAEDAEQQVQARVRSLLAGRNATLPVGRLHLQPRGLFLDVTRDEDLAWLVASCRRLGKIDLLILDPLRDISSAEENESDAMSNVMRRLRLLGELIDCTVCVIHHAPKSSGDTAKRRPGQNLRGSGAIHGAVDSGIYLADTDGDGVKVFSNAVTSEIRGGRGAGRFAIELAIEDDELGQAIKATWTVSRDTASTKKQSAKAKADAAEDQTMFGFVRTLAMRGEHLSRTALRDHDERPIGEKRVIPALDRLIESGKLMLVGRSVRLPEPKQAGAS